MERGLGGEVPVERPGPYFHYLTTHPMTDPDDRDIALHRLREHAERRTLLVQDASTKSPQEVQRLVQELQVYQIELEMQYEQLTSAQLTTEALRAQFVDLYEFAPVGYFTLDAQGQIQQLNLFACQLLGTTRQQLVRRRFPLFVALPDRERFFAFLQQQLTSEHSQTCELTMQREDGSAFRGQLNGLALRDEQGRVQLRLALSDVSARHRAVTELAASEAKFRRLFEQSEDATVLVRNMQIVDCNAAVLTMLGAAGREQVLHQSAVLLSPETQPDGRPSREAAYENTRLAQQQGSYRFDWQRHTFAGELMCQEITLTPIQLDGEVLMHAVWRDVTAQRAAREQLRREKDFSESLLDNSVDGIFAFDARRRLTAWNRVMADHTTRPAAEAVGRDLCGVLPLDENSRQEAAVRRVLAGERVVEYGLSFYAGPGDYDAYLVPLRDAAGAVSGALAILRDVTERNRLQEEATALKLRQQKEVLSAVLTTQEEERRRIAEALHNGVGQLLYATKLNLENQHAAGTREAALTLLDEAIKATRTISFELTPGILEDFGLATALQELVRRVPRASLDVQLHAAGLEAALPRLLEVAVYRIVQELLNNILKHAQAQEAFLHVVREDDSLLLSVEDNGVGLKPGVLSQPAVASGIGLTSIRNRIDLLGGQLTIDSRPSRGTIITITLPVKL